MSSLNDQGAVVPPPTTRTLELLPSPLQGFTVDNVLTVDECQQLIELSESAGLKWSGERNGPRFAGHRQRSTFLHPDWAAKIYDVLAPLLIEHASPVHHDKFGMQQDLLGPVIASGMYTIVGINELFRASKYDAPDGNFRRHTDTAYVRDDQFAGFWTVLIYLNDDFEGATSFYTDDATQCLHVVQPRQGRILAFHHYQVHDGRRVESGTKWLLRTELMYRRIGPSVRDVPLPSSSSPPPSSSSSSLSTSIKKLFM